MDQATIQTISAIAQSVCAVVAIIVTIAISRQTVKIRELSDVTDAMIEQNKELAKQTSQLIQHTDQLRASNEVFRQQYDLEYRLKLPSLIPFFERYSSDAQIQDSMGRHTIHLKNYGLKALDLNIHNSNTNFYNVSFEGREIDNGSILPLLILYNQPQFQHEKLYDFQLTFTANNQKMFQRIIQDDTHRDSYRIFSPQLMPDITDIFPAKT